MKITRPATPPAHSCDRHTGGKSFNPTFSAILQPLWVALHFWVTGLGIWLGLGPKSSRCIRISFLTEDKIKPVFFCVAPLCEAQTLGQAGIRSKPPQILGHVPGSQEKNTESSSVCFLSRQPQPWVGLTLGTSSSDRHERSHGTQQYTQGFCGLLLSVSTAIAWFCILTREGVPPQSSEPMTFPTDVPWNPKLQKGAIPLHQPFSA